MEETSINRRVFVITGLAAAAGLALRYGTRGAHAADQPLPAPQMVKIVEFSADGKRGAMVQVQTIVKSDADWKRVLPVESFEVTRHADTEFPGSGKYEHNKEHGLYRCICCDTALFSSETKFDSGTGWPSFWQAIAKENVHEITDSTLGMERTAVSCRRCESHLGHVFNDGPEPTGLRYCMNSVSLKFVKFA